MRRLAAVMVTLLLVQGCGGPQPLLSLVEKDYQPVRTGSWWTYSPVGPGTAFTRTVTSAVNSQGRNAYTVTLGAAAPMPAARFSGLISPDGDGLFVWDATPGTWRLERQLPYVVGSKWQLELSPGETSKEIEVNAMENVHTPAGVFTQCYRLVETTMAVSETARIIWAAPDVGDVQYGYLSGNADVVVEHRLSSYFLAP